MIVFLIAAIIGLWKKQPRNYWLALLAGVAIHFVTGLLFAGNGTLADARGDGYITAMVRQATNDGAAVAWLMVPVILLGWVLPLLLIRHNYQRRAPSKSPLPAGGPPSTN